MTDPKCKFHISKTDVYISRDKYIKKMDLVKQVNKCSKCNKYYLT